MSTPNGNQMSTNQMPEHSVTASDACLTDNTLTNPNGEVGEFLREQDRLLPIANVARIMKQAIPPNAKIAKDAKETVQECVSELISFVTSEACDRCQQEKRKTINGEDIVWAFEALGFDQYSHLMKIYLQRYKDVTKMDKTGTHFDTDQPGMFVAETQDGQFQ